MSDDRMCEKFSCSRPAVVSYAGPMRGNERRQRVVYVCQRHRKEFRGRFLEPLVLFPHEWFMLDRFAALGGSEGV